ncbi:MAG TPA: methionine ABC transporter ATP-binding protein [Clostridiales bacterium]|nr:methionine ABC transporter ATP-binding protein [Clostridiales bacterium]
MARARRRSRAPLLRVVDLRVEFRTARGRVQAVDGVSFSLDRGEALAVVGESGSGKSATALSLMRLLPEPPARVTGGRVLLRGRDILDLTEEDMRRVRGREMAMVFQEPAGALNPVMTVGRQVMEAVTAHRAVTRREARRLALLALAEAGVPSPAARFGHFPHQLSGGMKQRVMMAMALASGPALLIADEPTTALDVTAQRRVLDLLAYLRRRHGLALLLITHDLGVVAQVADRVAVLYAGRIVETAPVRSFFRGPVHPYARGLLDAARMATEAGELKAVPGGVPDPRGLPPGCRFAPRCRLRLAGGSAAGARRCLERLPAPVEVGPGHVVWCWRAGVVS